jgi:DNA-binding NarL/FixJ family response regulator
VSIYQLMSLEKTRIKVLLVDDHSVMREGVRMIIDNDDEIDVVGEAEDAPSTLKLVQSKKPDVVLLDIALVTGSSLPAIPKILEIHPEVRILILTGVMDEDIHRRALLLGAHGVMLKHRAGAVIVQAIKKVHSGEAWVDRQLTARVLHDAVQKDRTRSAIARKFDSLTHREREIVQLITEGHNNNFIADKLCMSEKTVRNRLTVVYDKLDVTSRLELALLASQEGIDLT